MLVAFDSLPLPQLLSLLVDRQHPFYYQTKVDRIKSVIRRHQPNQTQSPAPEDNLANTNNFDSKFSRSHNEQTSSMHKPTEHSSQHDVYENFPFYTLEAEHQNYHVAGGTSNSRFLEMMRHSVQPPHLVVAENTISNSHSAEESVAGKLI